MGTSLTGKQIKNTYKSLIKISDNTEASASAKQLSDGNGNDFGVYIDTDGVLGIGSAPSYSLDISSQTDGVALPVGTTANRPTASAGLLRYNSTIGKVEFYDTGWKTIFTTSGGTISGDVIITGDLTVQGDNTIIEAQTVEVEDNILNLNRTQGSPDTATATTSGISIYRGDGVTEASFIFDDADDTWDLTNNLTIAGDLTVDTNTLYVDSSNNRVGIGTLNPVDTLEVSGGITVDSSTSTLNLKGSNTGASLINFADTDDGNVGRIYYDHTSNFMQFKTNDAERMRIDSSGNVGIGTTSPSYKISTRTTGTTSEVIAGFGNNNIEGGLQVITSDGSLEWGLNALNARSLVFQTNQIERMRIGSSGNVGIGTTNPDAKLTAGSNLNNTASFDRNFQTRNALIAGLSGTAEAKLYLHRDDVTIDVNNILGEINFSGQDGGSYVGASIKGVAAGTWGSTTSHSDLTFQTTSVGSTSPTERMRIDSSGNVGIGTDTPSALLEIQTAATSGTQDFQIFSRGESPNYEVFKISRSAGSTELLANQNLTLSADYDNNHTGVDSNIILKTDATERMRITSSGNVGIGTTSPTYPLDVNGEIRTSSRLWISTVDALSLSGSDLRMGYTNSNILFRTNSGERMRIDSSGNVGIGTTSPSAKLDVSKNDSTAYDATNDNGQRANGATISVTNNNGTTNSFAQLVFDTAGTNQSIARIVAIRTGTSSNDMAFVVEGANTKREAMRITSGGDVLIGTTNTTSFGSGGSGFVAGSANRFILTQGSSTTASSTVQAYYNPNGLVGSIVINNSSTSYNTSSDYRLKENIVPMEGALDRVDALKPSRFNFIADADKTVDGFLAHEVADVVPEAISGTKDEVDEDGNPVYQGIDQSKLVPLLVGAIQELKARIETLENQ